MALLHSIHACDSCGKAFLSPADRGSRFSSTPGELVSLEIRVPSSALPDEIYSHETVLQVCPSHIEELFQLAVRKIVGDAEARTQQLSKFRAVVADADANVKRAPGE